MSKILNIKYVLYQAPGSILFYVLMDMDMDSVAGCASCSTLLSSGAVVLVSLMEQTGQEA